MRYSYVAYGPTGQQVKGSVEADSEQMAEQALWAADLVIVRIRPERPGGALSFSLEEQIPTLFGVKGGDVILITQQLASLLEAGVPLARGLEILARESPRPAVRRLVQGLLADIQTGSAFSEACRKRPAIFSDLYSRLMAVGESTGDLPPVLRQVAEHLTRQAAIRERLVRAMSYPGFVLLVALGVAAMLITQVLPAMAPLFREFGAELPLITRLLVAFSDLTINQGPLILGGLGLAALLLVGWWRTPGGNRLLLSALLHSPVLGPVLIKGTVAGITRTMGLLLGAGLPIVEVLSLVIATQNRVYRELLEQVREGLLAGQPLGPLLADSDLFPPLAAQLLAVGQETGTLQHNLQALTGFYEEESERAVTRMLAMMEPAMTIIVGIMVGAVAASVIGPLYSVLPTIR